MDYESIVALSQSLALVLFIGLFGIVLAYVFWPGSKSKFTRAANLPFERDGTNQYKKG
ncbi:MAG: cbb3-type cytochrome c oxidase subunit 3 [Alphaproteobacteria bacterium]